MNQTISIPPRSKSNYGYVRVERLGGSEVEISMGSQYYYESARQYDKQAEELEYYGSPLARRMREQAEKARAKGRALDYETARVLDNMDARRVKSNYCADRRVLGMRMNGVKYYLQNNETVEEY